MNTYQNQLIELTDKKEKLLAMIAPSFPVDFSHPEIIGMLKKLGFDRVTELTFGARMSNYWYVEYIKANPAQKYFIGSPCPVIISFVKAQYPALAQYLIPYSSPMVSMAKIVKKYYPDHKIVFISPCQAKRNLEAAKFPELINLTLTFAELKEIFDNKNILAGDFKDSEEVFDSFIQEYTKIYPLSGGLGESAHINKLFAPGEVCTEDTLPKIKPLLDEMRDGKSKYRFLDILNCPGGCIGGPGIANTSLSTAQRKQLVLDYRDKMEITGQVEGHAGQPKFELDLDFRVDV